MPEGETAATTGAPTEQAQGAAQEPGANNSIPTPERKHSKALMALVAIAIVVIAVSALLLTNLKPLQGTGQSTGQSTTIQQKPSVFNASIMSFATPSTIGSIFAPVSAGYYPYNVSVITGRAGALRRWPCYGINKALLVYSTSNLSTPTFLNASIEAKLNKALPLVFTSAAVLFNTSNVTTTSLPTSCRQLYLYMNSIYAQSFGIENITAQIGTDARLYKVVNFTPKGLAAENFSYGGAPPQISLYVASFIYKNVETNIGLFVFSQYANDTKVIDLARAMFSRIASYSQ